MEKQYPRYVYKSGTGKVVNDSGLVEAESLLLNSAEEFALLDGEWCDSPALAVAAPSTKKDVAHHEPEESAAKHHKKVK